MVVAIWMVKFRELGMAFDKPSNKMIPVKR